MHNDDYPSNAWGYQYEKLNFRAGAPPSDSPYYIFWLNRQERYEEAITIGECIRTRLGVSAAQIVDSALGNLRPNRLYFYVLSLKGLIEAYGKIGDEGNYVACLKEAHHLIPDDSRVLYSIGEYLYRTGDQEKAYDYYWRSWRADRQKGRKDPITMMRMAQIAKYLHDYSLAIQWFDEVLIIEPDNAMVHTDCAILSLVLADIDPDHSDTWIEKAAHHLQAIPIEQHDKHVKSIIVKYYLAAGNCEQAVSLAEQCLHSHPDGISQVLLMEALIRSGRAAEALARSEEFLRRRPRDKFLTEYKVKALFANGQYNEALEHQRAAVAATSMVPSMVALYLDMLLIMHRCGQSVDFSDMHSMCDRLGPFPESAKWGLPYYARAFIAQNKPERAIHMAQNAIGQEYNFAAMLILRHLVATGDFSAAAYQEICAVNKPIIPDDHYDLLTAPLPPDAVIETRRLMDRELHLMVVPKVWHPDVDPRPQWNEKRKLHYRCPRAPTPAGRRPQAQPVLQPAQRSR